MAKKYNCTKNGIQYFRKTKTIGHDINGNPVKKEFYGDGERDCDNQIEEYMNNLKSGLPINYEKITIGMAMHSWLFDVLFHADDFKSASFEKHETNLPRNVNGTEKWEIRSPCSWEAGIAQNSKMTVQKF